MPPGTPHAQENYLQELDQDTNCGIRKPISRWNKASKEAPTLKILRNNDWEVKHALTRVKKSIPSCMLERQLQTWTLREVLFGLSFNVVTVHLPALATLLLRRSVVVRVQQPAAARAVRWNWFWLQALHCFVSADRIRLIHLLLSQVYLPLVTAMENLMPLRSGVSLSTDTLQLSAFCHSDERIFCGQIVCVVPAASISACESVGSFAYSHQLHLQEFQGLLSTCLSLPEQPI